LNIRTRQEYRTVLPRLAAQERIAFTELGKLKPPASLATDWQRFVTGGQALARDTNQLGETITSHNGGSSRALMISAVKVQKSMRASAQRAGVTECAQLA
jgi:hypothetical protein